MSSTYRSRASYVSESGSDSDEYNITGYQSSRVSHRSPSSHMSSQSRSHHPRSHVSERSSYSHRPESHVSEQSYHSRRPESHVSERSHRSSRPESHVSMHSSHSRSQQSHAGSRHSSRYHSSARGDDSDNYDDDDGASTILPDDSASMMFMPTHTFRKYPTSKRSRDRDIDDLASHMSGSHISRHSHRSSRRSHVGQDEKVAAAWAQEEAERQHELYHARGSRTHSPGSERSSRHSRASRDGSEDTSDDARSYASRSSRNSHVSGSSRSTSTSMYSGTTHDYDEPRGKPMPKPVRRGTMREYETNDGRGTVLRKKDDGRMDWKRPTRKDSKNDPSVPRWLQYFTT